MFSFVGKLISWNNIRRVIWKTIISSSKICFRFMDQAIRSQVLHAVKSKLVALGSMRLAFILKAHVNEVMKFPRPNSLWNFQVSLTSACAPEILCHWHLYLESNKDLIYLKSSLISASYTVKCHCNAFHYNTNASLTRLILGSQTMPTCPHDHPRVAQHMG